MEAIKRKIRLQQKKQIQNERNTCAKSLKAFRMIVRARVFFFIQIHTFLCMLYFHLTHVWMVRTRDNYVFM